MAIYSFKVKKGIIQLDFLTTDKELVVEQFEKWVKDATLYAKKRKAKECKELVNSQIKEEEEITQKNIENHIARNEKKAERTIEKEKIPSLEGVSLNTKESIVNETNESLDVFYAPQQSKDSISSINSSQGVFDTILEKSLSNPRTELTFKSSPTIKKDNAFLNYIGTRKIERKIDYLLLTAYYFTQYEQKPRFTLKQLNAKLMQNIAVILDHSVLQEAINRDYIECLPDLTGLIGASEYRLTAYGEKVLLDE